MASKAKVGIEVTLVRFVEQHSADPGGRVIKDRGEDRGHHHDRVLADRLLSSRVTTTVCPALSPNISAMSRLRAVTRRGEQQNCAPAPRLAKSWRDRRRLSRTRRRIRTAPGPLDSAEQARDGMDGKIGRVGTALPVPVTSEPPRNREFGCLAKARPRRAGR
jgi:hypothetical protein